MTSLSDRREVERKQDLAWKLHLAGATAHDIALSKDPDRPGTLFKDARGAAQALRAARRRQEDESKEDPLSIEDRVKSDVARLDRIHRALYPKALAGDVSAAREIRQNTLAKAQLLGYIKGVDLDAKAKADDPIDDLARKRDERRRTAGS